MSSERVVIDTNVPVVANGKESGVSVSCAIACVEALEKVRAELIVVLDRRSEILREYMQNASLSGQPGVGDAFFKWLWVNQANERHCESIDTHLDSVRGFREFPDDPSLHLFDASDRKFVAVSIASAFRPPIYNAVDSDWWHHRDALARHAIVVNFLCGTARFHR